MSAVRIHCPNPECQASFSVAPGEASRFRRCPQCGAALAGLDDPASDGDPNTQRAWAQPHASLAEGSTFAGRYAIVRRIGCGGMGTVFLARDNELGRSVALKVPHIVGDAPEFVRRFRREARSAARLQHPNICPIHDVGEHGGQPYLTMAYIDGVSLADYLKRSGKPLGPGQAVRLVRTLALALQHAHDRGVVHRDLKPANIMMTREGRPTVMDFGVARLDDPNDSLRTSSGALMGTPAYMPLEQLRGDNQTIGPRTDVYSLGVVLFQLLTRRLPYQGNQLALFERLLTADRPPSPSTLRAGIAPALDAVCRKAMARDPEDRYGSMREMAAALDGCLEPAAAGQAKAVVAQAAPASSPVQAQPSPAPPAAPGSTTPETSVAGWRGDKAGDLKVLRFQDQELRFRWCPAGSFRMGSPPEEKDRDDDEDQVDVTLTRGYWMLETEVTQGLWQSVTGSKLDWSTRGEGPNFPVYNVSHAEAESFAAALTARLRAAGQLASGWKLGLPTEAQWEYAARAGTTTRFPFGDKDEGLAEYAWYAANSKARTHEVKTLKPNGWGLHDTLGNVWEWCADGYEDKLPGGVDPRGPSVAPGRVFRGGSWFLGPGYCRPASRGRDTPENRDENLGFRVAAVQ